MKKFSNEELDEYENAAIQEAINENNSIKIQLAELQQKCAELAAGREWMPIDSAPKQASVFLYCRFGVMAKGFYDTLSDKWIMSHSDGVVVEPIMWQPLPPSPKSED